MPVTAQLRLKAKQRFNDHGSIFPKSELWDWQELLQRIPIKRALPFCSGKRVKARPTIYSVIITLFVFWPGMSID